MAEPPITIRAAHDSGPFNSNPTRVVIHSTCPDIGYPRASAPGMARGTALYFSQTGSGGSAHYICDSGGMEEHCVPDNTVAWHAPPNEHSIGIEINSEGGDYPNNYTRDQWLSPQVWPGVLKAAQRTSELCDRFGIPKVRLSVADLEAGRRGICGHVDVSFAFGQTDHSDPGPNFPWNEFIAYVHGAVPPPPPPVTHTEDDTMYILIGDANHNNQPDGIAILSGSLLIGLGPEGSGEYNSAWGNVQSGKAVGQWVEAGTFAALDAQSHRVHDNPRPVTVVTPPVTPPPAAPAAK